MEQKTKKELQDEELDNVSGGAAVVTEPTTFGNNSICPKCKSKNVSSETTGSGCDQKTTYTCNDCGHTW